MWELFWRESIQPEEVGLTHLPIGNRRSDLIRIHFPSDVGFHAMRSGSFFLSASPAFRSLWFKAHLSEAFGSKPTFPKLLVSPAFRSFWFSPKFRPILRDPILSIAF